jgi:hypothetical protein
MHPVRKLEISGLIPLRPSNLSLAASLSVHDSVFYRRLCHNLCFAPGPTQNRMIAEGPDLVAGLLFESHSALNGGVLRQK